MTPVKKGFTLKGFVIGDILDGGMIVAIDDSDILSSDIGVLRAEETGCITINECSNSPYFGEAYGLKAFGDSENVDWLSSSDFPKNIQEGEE